MPTTPTATRFIKPAQAGAIVRDPVSLRPLAADGEEKPVNGYWTRRLGAGEVVEARRPADGISRPAPAKPGAKTAAKEG